MNSNSLLQASMLGLLAVAISAQSAPNQTQTTAIHLVYAQFDPLRGTPPVPAVLESGVDNALWIVQARQRPDEALRAAIRGAGGQIVNYLPEWAYLVRVDKSGASTLASSSLVRWVGAYHAAYRVEPFLFAELQGGKYVAPRRYNLVVANKHTDKPALGRKIIAIGGTVTHEQPGSLLFEVQLDSTQLLQVARLDEVVWIDRWSPPQLDMNNARSQGGADYVQAQGGYTGSGINGHVYEGVETTHPDFNTPPTNVLSGGGADDHGHCTAGCVCGNGTSSAAARGVAPDIRLFFTQYNSVTTGFSRWQVAQQLVNTHEVFFTTASWGGTLTTAYTSVSAEADDLLFDHDIIWSQSQSNEGNQDSRPQAWAKNIMSIGGVAHGNNSNRTDDSWDAGGASIGPAADGRIKPNLTCYYDAIHCSDRTGANGYASGNSYTGFGGTSGATPIVAGHTALALQMFTDHIFNNAPRVPGGSRFVNRPHNATHRALMYANARQYPFTSTSTDNRRQHQGWGFPDLRILYDNRQRMFIVDETDVLTQGGSVSYPVTVQPGDGELKVAMVFSDPAPNPGAGFTAVNNLDLKVTAPDGTIYWGNQGLTAGNYSTAGGSPDARDTVECVFVNAPAAGIWTVEVSALLVAMDGHVESPATDADFGLCVSFGRTNGSLQSYGTGCPGSVLAPNTCASINPAGGSLSVAVRQYEYAYRLTAASALQVVGFEVFSAAPGGAVTVAARIYGSNGTQPAAVPLATTTVTIGSVQGFYTGTFSSPVAIPPGQFYIGIDHSAQTTNLSNLSAGTTTATFYRTPPSGTWSQSTLVTRPSVRALCPGTTGFRTPAFVITGAPGVGNTLTETLNGALPSAPALLVVGLSNTTWSGGSLPFSFAGMGAPLCSLLASPDALGTFVTTAAGAVVSLRNIPGTSSLIGLRLFEQFFVLDAAANALGANASNAFSIFVGSN